MRKLVNVLLREPCDESEILILEGEVGRMYHDLEARAVETDGDIRRLAHKRIQGIVTTAKMQKTMFDFHCQVVSRENFQLLRLKKKHASLPDIKILAETIHIYRRYGAHGKKWNFFLASTDSNNFSPATSPWGESRTVTDEIARRYGVICDWPNAILPLF